MSDIPTNNVHNAGAVSSSDWTPLADMLAILGRLIDTLVEAWS